MSTILSKGNEIVGGSKAQVCITHERLADPVDIMQPMAVSVVIQLMVVVVNGGFIVLQVSNHLLQTRSISHKIL